jgi:hypothetical protein
MLGYIGCFIAGGIVGLVIIPCYSAAKKGYKKHRYKEHQYKCKVDTNRQCADTCCKTCFGASDCDWACEGDPSSCGISARID